MALDEALMSETRRESVWILRVYSWSVPTLSLGRNQRARGGYNLSRLAARGIDVVRRPTGGRAILHDREVTYSVAAPVTDAGDLRESYRRINRLLIAALHTLGVGAVAVVDEKDHVARSNDDTELARPGFLPCFHHPSIGEIMLDGRKLVGSAQWRCDGALLQHGSILVDDDQTQLSSFLVEQATPVPQPATLRSALGRAPSDIEVADALFAAVRANEDPTATESEVGAAVMERANALRSQYLDDGWTWRR